jgi:hypothetical protein
MRCVQGEAAARAWQGTSGERPRCKVEAAMGGGIAGRQREEGCRPWGGRQRPDEGCRGGARERCGGRCGSRGQK